MNLISRIKGNVNNEFEALIATMLVALSINGIASTVLTSDASISTSIKEAYVLVRTVAT